ncbi:MAG: PLP-dependent aminotransferase family protein [Desulfobacterales bacterium]|nr:MAG: PLP-dependent aminotransferase family protein [Desulfobacterales bacterium]
MVLEKHKIITADFNLPPGMIDLSIGQPSMSLLPLAALAQAAEHCLSQNNPYILAYGAEQGNWYFRSALAGFLSEAYHFRVDPAYLFTTTGASQGLDYVCRLFTQPCDTVFVENPTYSLALGIFADHRLNVVGLPMDEDGLIVEALEERLPHERPTFLYTIPTFHNPSSRTLSAARREKLVQLSLDYNFKIVADEVYQLLAYTITPPPPMAKYTEYGTVLSLGSFSKILAPGLRLGWIQTHPELMAKLINNGLIFSGGGLNPFTSAIVQSAIELGLQAKQLSHLKKVYLQRMNALNFALREHLRDLVSFVEPEGGFFTWVRLPQEIDARKLLPGANKHHVNFPPGSNFSPQRNFRNYMRLSFAYYDASELKEAVERLADVIH